MASFFKTLFRRGHDDHAMLAPGPAAFESVPPLPAAARPARDGLPRFKPLAELRSAVEEREQVASTRLKLRHAFTPTQPVTDRRLFAGRVSVLGHLIEVIESRLAHVVVFGERGIGKTSLLHILSDLAHESDYVTVRATCGAASEFDVLFRTLLRDIPIIYHNSVSPTETGQGRSSLADLLPDRQFDARELSELLSGVTSCRVLILLDEYDRLESESFRINTAELIKNLSDRAAPVQLVIAGVASNLHELIGYIPSIRRSIVGLPLPKLDAGEVGEIVHRGEEVSGISFDADVQRLINELSQGSPYLVRLVCYHSSLVALADDRLNVCPTDIRDGLDQMVDEAAARLTVPALQRTAQLDWHRDADKLTRVVHLAGTASGWFSLLDISDQIVDPAERARVETYIREDLVPKRLMAEDGPGADLRFRFVEEGLQSFLWIALARRRMTAELR